MGFGAATARRGRSIEEKKSGAALAEGEVTYRFYLLDHHAVDLSAHVLYMDDSEMPPEMPSETPRTQHAYKAQVWYKQDALSRFSVVASFENGHSGPVFTRLRQFFLGVGAEMLFQGSK